MGTSLGESLLSIQSPCTQPLGAGHLLLLPPPLHLSRTENPVVRLLHLCENPGVGFPDPYQLLLSAEIQARTPTSISSRT